MGCLRLVNSSKLKVSFAEYRLFYRALSHKGPIILRCLLTDKCDFLRCKSLTPSIREVCCRVLQHTATHSNSLQHTATHCNTLQHTALHCNTLQIIDSIVTSRVLQRVAVRIVAQVCCSVLQHTTTHCNTLQHTATHCNTLHHTATHCNTLQHTASHCFTLRIVD